MPICTAAKACSAMIVEINSVFCLLRVQQSIYNSIDFMRHRPYQWPILHYVFRAWWILFLNSLTPRLETERKINRSIFKSSNDTLVEATANVIGCFGLETQTLCKMLHWIPMIQEVAIRYADSSTDRECDFYCIWP